MLAVLCLVELVCYFRWHSKAKAAAQYGDFLKATSTSKFQKLVLNITMLCLVFWAIHFIICGDNLQKWVGIVMCIYMPALFTIVNATKEFLKRKKASRGLNRTATILISFTAAFAMMGLITFGMLYASNRGLFADKNEELYEHNGTTWVIHQDELPLVVEDLIDTDFDGYIKERRGNMSLIFGQLVLRQYPRFDAESYGKIPQLEYTMTIVRVPALYNMCKEIMIHDGEYYRQTKEKEYRTEAAAPWGAQEAYRLHDPEYGARNTYLLCYGDLIVEIRFDWEPTAVQMAIVGEKLTNKGEAS